MGWGERASEGFWARCFHREAALLGVGMDWAASAGHFGVHGGIMVAHSHTVLDLSQVAIGFVGWVCGTRRFKMTLIRHPLHAQGVKPQKVAFTLLRICSDLRPALSPCKNGTQNSLFFRPHMMQETCDMKNTTEPHSRLLGWPVLTPALSTPVVSSALLCAVRGAS